MIPIRNIRRFAGKAARQPLYAARVAAKRAVAYGYYYLGDGRAPQPEAVTFFLTHRCNLRCKMCGQWGEGGVTKNQSPEAVRQELSGEELFAIVDSIAPFRPNITLFGGEPFLHPAALDLIKRIHERGMHSLVITNGFMVEGVAERLVASGLDELNVSLDGPRELHDEIRGLPGLFERIMAGLVKVAAAKKAAGKKRPLVNLQCTITKFNYHALDSMLRVAEAAGADSLTFHNLIFLDKAVLDRQRPHDERLACSSADWQGFAFEPGIDAEALWRKMEEVRRAARPHRFAVDFYPNFTREELVDYYGNPAFAPRGTSGICLSPWIVAYICPDGAVRPCLNSTYAYGNVRDGGLAKAWNSDKAIAYRQYLKKAGAFPVCARCTELYRY